MGRGYLQKLLAKIRWYVVAVIFVSCGLVIGLDYLLGSVYQMGAVQSAVILVVFALIVSLTVGYIASAYVSQPMKFLTQAILHVSPSERLVAAPDMDKLKIGRELVVSLTRQVYDFASGSSGDNSSEQNSMLKQLPIPVLSLDSKNNIVYANPEAEKYLLPQKSLVGENFFNALNLTYEDNETLPQWAENIRKQKITACRSWERIKLNLTNAEPKYFDMAASYSKDSNDGAEIMVAIFDHTQRYSVDDQSMSFIALAVHELRTPLTLLRGYIEVFEDELDDKLDDEMRDFMRKMHASAESLTTFVSNILNVAKVDQDQLPLTLEEGDWPTILHDAVNAMQLRASVHGKTIELSIDENLPSVAVDKVSITEVVNNLLDNAIKYSTKDAEKIVVKSVADQNGMIETTVQDSGIGIPTSVMPHLFEKFYRNHRSKASIGGSGLGLYLSKAIISAHGGNIWASANKDRGSTFGFSIMPYSRLAEERKNPDNNNITRSSHGWIKNHSMQRR